MLLPQKNKLSKSNKKIINAAPKNHVDSARKQIMSIQDDFAAFEKSIDAETSAASGSAQERKGLDGAFGAHHILAIDSSAI